MGKRVRAIVTEDGPATTSDAVPCTYVCEEWQKLSTNHGEDFFAASVSWGLKQLDNFLARHLKVKIELWVRPTGAAQRRFLNKIMAWCERGFTLKLRHVAWLVAMLNLDDANGCDTPDTKNSWKGPEDALDSLGAADARGSNEPW